MAKGKWITEETKESIVYKLKPYLNAGLSLHLACIKTGVSRSVVYNLMKEDEVFKDKIEAERKAPLILANQVIIYKINKIAEKVNNKENLDKDDIELIKWYLTNSRVAKEEYGKPLELEFNETKTDMIELLKELFKDEK